MDKVKYKIVDLVESGIVCRVMHDLQSPFEGNCAYEYIINDAAFTDFLEKEAEQGWEFECAIQFCTLPPDDGTMTRKSLNAGCVKKILLCTKVPFNPYR